MNYKEEHINIEVQEFNQNRIDELVAERKEEALNKVIKEIKEVMASKKTKEEKVEEIDEITNFYFNLKGINFYEEGL